MTKPVRCSSLIWCIRLRAASTALALAAVLLLVVVASQPAQAQTFDTLYSFDGKDGANPYYGAVVQGVDGNFYGTTERGGDNNDGTVFKITPGGVLTTLHSFDGKDGSQPYAGLVQATNGLFYGTTLEGGANNICDQGCGTVFRITPGGTLTTLHSFDGRDSSNPSTGLIQATNGNFYGTTSQGGANGYGSIFKMEPQGGLTTLYSFCAEKLCKDGAYPNGLVQATDGNFYGTTEVYGASACGTVFKITPGGTLTTLYRFEYTDGAGCSPYGTLVQATNGLFYGTTTLGGRLDLCDSGCGTVFKITPKGRLTTLHSFDITDGANPYDGLVQATDGNFYGTTNQDGANIYFGTVFEITAGGILTTLHSFDGTDGMYSYASLLQATNGLFYGTTHGSSISYGTIFTLSVGLGPFVETLPTSGKVGTSVKILGTKLAGATSVTFNGKAATFKVVSSTEITTTVPTGATTGKVKVKTPSGTLTSNVSFRVP